MSARDWSGEHRSELSVFTTRRVPVVDLAAEHRWAPAGGEAPLGDVLDRLLEGLATSG
jgi:hypothetical protein